MSQTLECPACGAPLEAQTAEPSQRCPFCGQTVSVPESFRTGGPPGMVVSVSLGGEEAPRARPARLGSGARAVIWIIVIITLLSGLIGLVGAVVAPLIVADQVRQSISVVSTAQPALPTWPSLPGASTLRPTLTPTPGYADVDLDFGGEGIGPGQFEDARSIAVDGEGRIYVAEYTGGRLQIFNDQGKFLRQIRLDPELPVMGIAVQRDGRLYVSIGGELLLFDGETGQPAGQISPAGSDWFGDVVVTPDGKIAVVATSAQNPDDIAMLDADGRELARIRGAFGAQTGQPELDMTLAVDGRGTLYALGSFNSAVVIYSPDGQFIDRFGSRGDQPGQFSAVQGLTVDGQSRLYVSGISDIQVFDTSGRYLGRIERVETVYFGLTVDDQDRLLVAARTRVYRFMVN